MITTQIVEGVKVRPRPEKSPPARKIGETAFFWGSSKLYEADQSGVTMAARLAPRAVSVYSFLAVCANDSQQCWPSVETIAAMTGQSPNTTRAALTDLESHGLIEVLPCCDESGRSETPLYTLLSTRRWHVPEAVTTPAEKPAPTEKTAQRAARVAQAKAKRKERKADEKTRRESAKRAGEGSEFEAPKNQKTGVQNLGIGEGSKFEPEQQRSTHTSKNINKNNINSYSSAREENVVEEKKKEKKGKDNQTTLPGTAAVLTPPAATPDLLAALHSRAVLPTMSPKLAARGEELCWAWLEYQHNHARNTRAGFLVKNILAGEFPPGYITREERDARARKRDKERDLILRAGAFFESLGANQQREYEADFDAEWRKTYREDVFARSNHDHLVVWSRHLLREETQAWLFSLPREGEMPEETPRREFKSLASTQGRGARIVHFAMRLSGELADGFDADAWRRAHVVGMSDDDWVTLLHIAEKRPQTPTDARKMLASLTEPQAEEVAAPEPSVRETADVQTPDDDEVFDDSEYSDGATIDEAEYVRLVGARLADEVRRGEYSLSQLAQQRAANLLGGAENDALWAKIETTVAELCKAAKAA